jgi:hypothetical protein
MLPAEGRYDCAISRPLSSRQRVRLEALVEGPIGVAGAGGGASGGGFLEAPLTRRPCVLFSAAASRKLHEGAPPVPVAFASGHARGFMVRLLAPGVPSAGSKDSTIRVEIDGEDVSLFSMCEGRVSETRSFSGAPDQWQDFVLAHRACLPMSAAGGQSAGSARWVADGGALEFQECALLAGARVTLVGELCRLPSGALSLRPFQGRSGGKDKEGGGRAPAQGSPGEPPLESWRTSWERPPPPFSTPASLQVNSGCGEGSSEGMERVMVSDDPQLLLSVPG